MSRGRHGRPLVSGRIEPLHGLIFGIALGALAFVQVALTVNLLAAGLAMAGLRLRLRLHAVVTQPHDAQNVFIGKTSGAVPPLVGWQRR